MTLKSIGIWYLVFGNGNYWTPIPIINITISLLIRNNFKDILLDIEVSVQVDDPY